MKHLITTWMFVLLLPTVIHAQAQNTKSKAIPAPVKVVTVEGVTEYQLGNGLRVLIFPDPSVATMTVNVTYLVGSRLEGYGETGMAHLLEHMLFKGSPRHKNIPQEQTAHGAFPNGSTWYDRTNYFETFSAIDSNLRWALDLESDRMVNSFIAKKDLESEFSVVRNEFEMGENFPSEVLQERVMSTAYLWHNYGKSTIGSKEDIEKVPIESLQQFYKKYYQPDNAVVIVAGKIDEDKTIQLVNQYFGKIPKPTRVLHEAYTVEPAQDGERMVTLRRVGDVQVAACGYHICAGSGVDFAALNLLIDILSNEPSGRLYKALVETRKASSVNAMAFELKDPGFFYISADVPKEKSLDDVKNTMLNLLDSLQFNPVTDAELERAKNKSAKDFEQMYNNSSYVGLTLSEYIAEGDWRLFFLDRDRAATVTAADVNTVIKKYLKPSNRTIGLFIPEQNPDRAQIPMPPNVDSLVKNYTGKQALANAEAFDPSPANIDARTKTGTIAGGAQYAFLKKTTRGNKVTLNLTLRIGSQSSLENKSTIADLTADMLNKGTSNRTRQQINDELDKLKAEINIFGGEQTVNIMLSTTNENLLPALDIISDMLRHPTFPVDEFDKLKQEDNDQLEQQKSEPLSIASNVFTRLMNPYPKSDFRYTSTFDESIEDYKNAKLDDVKKFYDDFYNSSNATLAIVGDFDETATLTALQNLLGNWGSPQKYERAASKYFDVPASAQKINTPDKANAMFQAGYNIAIRDDNPDYPAIIMGNYMLGGGFLNSRLATRIRQKEGISYGVGSYFYADPWDQSGAFGSYAIYNPQNSDRLMTAYKQVIDSVLKFGFADNELKDAKTGYLESINVSRAQDASLANRLSRNLYLHRTMQWSADLEKKIGDLTVDQVNAAMRKYIQPEKITYVQAGDFDKKQQ